MKSIFFISFRMLLIMTVLTGIVYPLFITGAAQLFFRYQAEGSLIERGGITIGSTLIGQQTDSSIYFSCRPSAVDYQTVPSGASNLSWTDPRLKEIIAARQALFAGENLMEDTSEVPAEMLCASASGLDPHISPRAALLQVERIAQARKYSADQKEKLIAMIGNLVEKPQYALFGEERINVLLLNIELEKIK